MTSLILNGTIEKDAFKLSGGDSSGVPTMYGKLVVIVEKGHPKRIEAADLNIDKLNKLSLLVLKTKDEKYDGIDIKYKVNMEGEDEAEEAKLNSTKVLWLNLENKKPYSSIVSDKTAIKDIVLWLDKEQPAEEATVEIMALRRVETQEPPEEKTSKAKKTSE